MGVLCRAESLAKIYAMGIHVAFADKIELSNRAEDLIGKPFISMDLSDAIFSGSCLMGADFTKSNLAGANFSNCDLLGASLVGCDLTGADFEGASFCGVKIDPETASYILDENRAIPLTAQQVYDIALGAASHEPAELELSHVVNKGEREAVLAKKEEFLARCESLLESDKGIKVDCKKIGEIRASIAEERAHYAEGEAEILKIDQELAQLAEVYKKEHGIGVVAKQMPKFLYHGNVPFPNKILEQAGVPIKRMSIPMQRCMRSLVDKPIGHC